MLSTRSEKGRWVKTVTRPRKSNVGSGTLELNDRSCITSIGKHAHCFYKPSFNKVGTQQAGTPSYRT